MSLRGKLLVLLLAAAALPVSLAGYLAYQKAESALTAEISAVTSRTAAAEAEFFARYLESVGRELHGALAFEDTGAMSPSETQEFLTRVFLRRRSFSTATLFEGDGKLAAAVFVDDPEAFARQEPEFRLHDVVSPEEAEDFQARAAALLATPGKEGVRHLVSPPYLTKTRRRPAVAVVVPPPSSGAHALAVELTMDELSERLAKNYAADTKAFFVDAGGAIVVHPDPSVPRSGAVFGKRPPSGVGEVPVNGEAQLCAWSEPVAPGVTAVVTRPKASALQPLVALFNSTVVVLVATVLLAAFLAALAAGAFARPIQRLTEGAAELAKGKLGHRIAVTRKDELGVLARTFNEMGQNLEAANAKLVRFNEDLQRQVEERTRELKIAQQQLMRSQKLSAMSDLSAGLAHEINNPLSAIVGNAQLLQLELNPEGATKAMLDDVLGEALRISDIIKNLQALAESQKGGLIPMGIDAVVGRVLEKERAKLEADAVTVSPKLHADGFKILGNEAQLEEVLVALLSNARNALKDRPEKRVTVETQPIEGGAVRLSVADTGCGIAKEHLERIFNPFFTTKKSWSGKGLSLSICHKVVENHGGRITVESQEGVGTTVNVVLPAAPAATHLR